MNSPKRYEDAIVVMLMILQDLGLDSTSQTNNTELWVRWIFQAMRDLRLSVLFDKKEETGSVSDCQVRKPCGFVSLVDAFIEEDSSGMTRCVAPINKIKSRPSSISNFNQQQDKPKNFFAYEIEESPFFFTLSSNANGKRYLIRYTGYEFGESGLPIVDMHYYDAIRSYCEWAWKKRMSIVDPLKYSDGQVAAAWKEYVVMQRRNKSGVFHDSMTRDFVNQLMAEFFDPRYVNQNPYWNIEKTISTYKDLGGITSSYRIFR